VMKKFPYTIVLLLFVSLGHSQYTTLGTGVNWTLLDIFDNPPAGVLTFETGIYTLTQSLTITVSDQLTIDENTTLHIDPNVQITIAGAMVADAAEILITASDVAAPYDSIRFEEGSSGYFNNTTIDYGKGIRVSTGDFEMQNSS